MRHVSAWLGCTLFVAGLVTAAAGASRAEGLLLLSTQLRPIEEAQKMRKVILKDFTREVDYVTEQPSQLPVRIKADQQRRHTHYRRHRRAAWRAAAACAVRRTRAAR